ncbi:hypothetical protein [Trichormus azollae]|uniref:hypothetical protein n=1 Tax=Trichormus azollae TaxID=1164 RepID=UPI00325C8893
MKVSKRKFLDFLEKLTNTFVVLHKFVHTSKLDDKRLIQNEPEGLLDGMKDDIKYSQATLTHHQDISDYKFYQQFINTFRKEEADRGWYKKLVLRDFLRILMGKPELHQRIKNRGTNFDECFAVTFAKSRLMILKLCRTKQKSKQ